MKCAIGVTLLTLLGTGLAGPLRTAQAQQPVDPRIAAWDKGPTKIDISRYPPELQKVYPVFRKKCGACHTVARVINSDLVLEGEWEADVHAMAAKAGRLMNADDAKQIYDFLVYDSKIRKPALYQQRQVAAASPAIRAVQPRNPAASARRAQASPEMIATFDKGPATIDVSSYLPELQKAYPVFRKKCSVCHTIARSINSDLVLEADWEGEVNDMAARAGTLMSADEAKQIYDFLVYDSKIRKPDLYRQRQLEAAAKLPEPIGAKK